MMLSIGEFSNICRVSTKTLRYYAEIGLLLPAQINSENGYRYYSVEQLETMLLINRLKNYRFSLEEIKEILESGEEQEEKLYFALRKKKKEIQNQIEIMQKNIGELNKDLSSLEQGKSIMSYMENIAVKLVELPKMYLLSIRKMVQQQDFEQEYGNCFGSLLKKIEEEHFTMVAPPMVMFHSEEFRVFGLDTEFAIPVREYVTGTRDFSPGLCLKTVVKGEYTNLPSAYTQLIRWAKKEGYENTNPLFEVYVTDPSQTAQKKDFVTEVYYPVKKRGV